MRIVAVIAVAILAPVVMASQDQPSGTQNRRNAQQANQPSPISVNCNCTTQAEDGKNKPQGWHKLITWPEGIATWALILTLGAIVWQAIESHQAAEAAKNAADAAEQNADALINAERAWVLGELGFYEGSSGNVIRTAKQDVTWVYVKLTCRNDGKSPAWIDDILGIAEVSRAGKVVDSAPDVSTLGNNGPMEPLGPGQERSRSLEFACLGFPGEREFFSVYVLVRYRDVFDIHRETSMSYFVDAAGRNIGRQYALRCRNRNT